MTLNTLPFIGIATATIISVLANPVTPYGSSYLSTFPIAHTHTHTDVSLRVTRRAHTHEHVGGRNSLGAFQDGIYLQTSIYTKTQLNKCFACKSLNNRIGCMNTVELHQYGVGIFFLMRWKKKYTHIQSHRNWAEREWEKEHEKSHSRHRHCGLIFSSSWRWVRMSLSLKFLSVNVVDNSVSWFLSSAFSIAFNFYSTANAANVCVCVCVSCHIFFFFFSILTTMFLLLLLFLSLLFYCR